MKLKEAMKIIGKDDSGFMVHFEKVEGAMLCGGYFPDKHDGENLIETAEEAWLLAQRFASKTKGKYVNIYVIDGDFKPVHDYKMRTFKNR